MAISIEPLTVEDIPICTEIYLQAFAKDEFSLAAFPRTDLVSLSAWWTNMFLDEYQSQKAARFIKAAIDGQIVAFAKWNIPTRNADGKLERGGDDPDSDDQPTFPAHANPDLAMKFLGTLARKRSQIMSDRPHCYLEMVATLPKYQGQGAASKLLQWGLDIADKMEMEAYLEGNEENISFYKKFGFAVVEDYILEELDYRESFMLRAAKKSDPHE